MAFNAGAVLRADMVGTIDASSQIVNSYQFQLSGASGVPEGTVWTDLRDILENLYQIIDGLCNIRTVFSGVYASTLDGNMVSGFMPFTTPIPGALNTNMTPRGVAALISFPTGQSRRVLRKYIGALDDTVVSVGGNMTAGGQAIMATVATFLLTPQTISGRTYTYGYTPGFPEPFLTPLNAIVSAIPAYQRRRRVGTGA